jgi:hypothetical protein
MSDERKILDEMTIQILKNYLSRESALVNILTHYFNKVNVNQEEIPSSTVDAIITYITEYMRAVRLYLNLLEKTSSSEVIKAYAEEHEQQLKESDKLVEQVLRKTNTYIQ